MGVTDLNAFLVGTVPSVEVRGRLDDFRGHRVGVDAINMMYKYMSPVHHDMVKSIDVIYQEVDYEERRKAFISRYMDFALMLMEHGITPIFIFDGKKAENKEQELEKRKQAREKLNQDIEDLRAKLQGQNALDRDIADVNLLRQKLRNNLKIKADDVEILKIMLRGMGIPLVTAKGEADPLGAALAIEGKISAMISTDRDFFVHQCPCVITEIESPILDVSTQKYIRVCKVIKYDTIIKGLGITPDQFVDFCICCGCDYNNKKKLYRINNFNIFELIKLHKTIEEIGENGYNISELNHLEARKMFSYTNSWKLSADYLIQLNVDQEKVRDPVINQFMATYGFERYVIAFEQMYATLPPLPMVVRSETSRKPNLKIVKGGSTSPVSSVSLPLSSRISPFKITTPTATPEISSQPSSEVNFDLDDFL